MINQDFEMKNSKQILWFFGGILVGTATGIAAGGRIEASKSFHRLCSETSMLDQKLRTRAQGIKKAVASGTGNFTNTVKKNLSNPIPDLYKATENLTIAQPETYYDW